MRRRRRFVCGCFIVGVVIFGVVGSARAQTGQVSGEITGTVVDGQGAILPGVTVNLSGTAIMGAQTTTTSDRGIYHFPFLPSGTYTLRFELQGFQTVVREGLIVTARTTTTQDATLDVASVQESVTVTGASPVVDVSNTKMGQRLEEGLLAAVPTTRSLFGAVSQLPGVVMGRPDIGGFNSFQPPSVIAHGQTAYQITVMGTRAEGVTQNGSYYYTDFNMMEEVSVESAAMSAEVGPAGAMVNIIPKAGGNNFKGSAYFTGSGKSFASDNIDDSLRSLGFGTPPLPISLYDVNIDGGGRLKTDRVWWYGSYRDWDYKDTIVGFPLDHSARLANFIVRPTVQLTPNNKLSFVEAYSGKWEPYRDASFTVPPISTQYYYQPIDVENLTWTSVLGRNTFLEVVTGHYRLDIERNPSREFDANPASPTLDIATSVRSGEHSGGSHFEIPNTFTTNAAVTHYSDKLIGGSHQLKAGYQSDYGIASVTDAVYGDVELDYRSAVPSQILAYNSPVTAKYAVLNQAGFIQDRITYPRISLNLGLRYQHSHGWLPEQTGGGGLWIPQTVYPYTDTPFRWGNFAPRSGFALKLTKDAKNVVKGSYSRYFDILTSGDYQVINPNTFVSIATYAWKGDLNNNGFVDTGEYSPTPLSRFVAKSNSIDPNFKDPKVDEVTLAYEREVMPNAGLSVAWVQRWFTDNWASEDVGIPTSAYTPATFADPGPDNIKGTADDRSITMYNVQPAYLGKDAFLQTTVPGTQVYKSLELSFTKRMTNRWQFIGSYTFTRQNGVILAGNRKTVADPTNPNASLDSNKFGSAASETPHALKILLNVIAPYGFNVGLNYQGLSGMPVSRQFRATLSQGSVTINAEQLGTYRADFQNLLALKVDRPVRLGRFRAGVFAELHNLLNSNAGITYGTLTSSFANQAALGAANLTNTAYFDRPTVILTPRVLKFGARFDF